MSSTKDIMPATQMANAGDLGKLPPEIRKEIYTYLLVEPNIIAIKRFLRAKSKHKYDTVALRLRTKRSTGILRVNKFVNDEAVKALYGCNKFEFLNAVALHHFIEQIGDARKYLRHVAIYQDGLTFMKSWKSMQQSIQALASVKGLRTLEVSHSALCRHGTPKSSIEDLVRRCKPLLHALNAEFVKRSLKSNVFDAIQIVLPLSDCESLVHRTLCSAKYEHPRRAFITNYATKLSRKIRSVLECGCHCRKADVVNNELNQQLKEEIAKQLKLELP